MPKNTNSNTAIALIQKDIEFIKSEMSDVKSALSSMQQSYQQEFITRAEFAPVRQIVYGLVALILVAVVGALLTLVIRR